MEGNKKTCSHCHKILPLVRFKCMYCKNDYCIKHRTPEDHTCNQDYKGSNKTKLKASLEKCSTKETHGYTGF